jgi:hypothetical protein
MEFVLTGDITRLAGTGTQGLSIRTHGPHVDCRDLPDSALVRVTVWLQGLGVQVVAERRVSDPGRLLLNPDTAMIRERFEVFAQHREFALTRKEILKFICCTPGDRAKEVQALLRLEQIERVRASFKSLLNSARRDSKVAESAHAAANAGLLSALQIAEVRKESTLEAVNERRRVLCMPDLTELNPDTSFADGLPDGKDAKARPKVKRAAALEDLASTVIKTSAIPATVERNVETLRSVLGELDSNPALLENVSRQAFYELGVKLIAGPSCPLCEQDAEFDLRANIEAKIERNRTAKKKLSEAEISSSVVRTHLAEVRKLAELATVGKRQMPRLVPAVLAVL